MADQAGEAQIPPSPERHNPEVSALNVITKKDIMPGTYQGDAAAWTLDKYGDG